MGPGPYIKLFMSHETFVHGQGGLEPDIYGVGLWAAGLLGPTLPKWVQGHIQSGSCDINNSIYGQGGPEPDI